MWEHFEHRADIGLRGYGHSLEAAFEQAAVALTAVITDPKGVAGAAQIRVRCSAPDRELLLVAWLNSLVYEMAIRRMLFSTFTVNINGNDLTATLRGEAVDRDRHQPAVEVKGATYTELAVRELDKGGWLAQCVMDV